MSLASASWVATYSLMPHLISSTDMGMMGVSSIVSSLSPSSIGLFELVWVIGMVAMMFPAILPVAVFYNRMVARAESSPSTAKVFGTALFLLGYLATYAALGFLAYLAVFFGISLTMVLPSLNSVAFFAPSLVLAFAGIYQLSPLKLKSLSHCVSPLGFFAAHLHRGLTGSLRMGVSHGTYCVGCCWAFMLVMLAVGAMSIPFMAVLAALIALEKVVIRGALWFDRTVAAGFIAAGILVLVSPSLVGM